MLSRQNARPLIYGPRHGSDAFATEGYSFPQWVVSTRTCVHVVEEQRLGFAATICDDGSVNLSPKGAVTVLDDDHLMFADLASPQTVKNLRTNPSIEINVVDPVVRKGFRFKGRGIVVDPGKRFDELMTRTRIAGDSSEPEQ